MIAACQTLTQHCVFAQASSTRGSQVTPFTQIAAVPRRSQPQVCRSISSGRNAGFAFAARTAKRRRIIHECVFAAHDAGQLARRQLLHIPALTLAGLLLQSDVASAVDQDLREKLLTAIKGGKDEEIEKALRALSEQNPTKGPARSDKLFGKWKLLWASPNSEVAKATKRNPLPSYSEQRIGEPGGEKKERAANLINIGNGAVQVYLSSAAREDPKSDDTVLIGPPFFLELKIAGFTLPIQNTQKEGERTQLLGSEQNYYKQLYLENTGNPGDLRISEVTFGDPAAQGSIFVHERI